MTTLKKILCVFLAALLMMGVAAMGAGAAPAATTQGPEFVQNSWWQILPSGVQWFLYYFCFGWIWMSPVKAIPEDAVKGIQFNGSSAYAMAVGKTQALTWTITPSNAKNKKVTLKSSNTSVATVSTAGVVTAVGPGTATITVTANDKAAGTFSDTVTFTVQEVIVTGFDVSGSGTVKIGSTIQLTASKFTGTGGQTPSNTTVTWSSSDSSVAVVTTANGVVFGVKAGYVNITATANDSGKYSKTVRIEVKS